jgi:hypothetical protein
VNDFDFQALTQILPAGQVLTTGSQMETLSRDFYWYSPVLKRDLESKRAEAIAQPKSVAELKAIIRLAFQRRLALTLRGAGTGNYGQCIPTHGGIVVDLAAMDRVHEITAGGIAICDPAARLATIETVARSAGWELRCYPSTFVKATVAGFCAGGSGGIGSITWGGLRENGTVHALTILTMEAEPQELRLEGRDIFKVLHAWGTNGIIVGVELRLAPRQNWAQLAVAHDTFAQSLDFVEAVARNDSFPKRLVSNFEWPLPKHFTPLQKWVPAGRALAFIEVADEHLDRLASVSETTGGTVVFRSPYSEPRKGPLLSDYTWNHTTLWALKGDPSLTYLQCGFVAARVREQIGLLKARYGDDMLMHFEFVKWEGVISPGSIPVVRYTTDERLQEMIQYCGEIGVSVANPHVNFLEGSGRWRPDDEKLQAKQAYDPRGLLNPGKMRGMAAQFEHVPDAPDERPADVSATGS